VQQNKNRVKSSSTPTPGENKMHPPLLHASPALSQSTSPPLSLRVVTFNIRYAATSRSSNEKPWSTTFRAQQQPSLCRAPYLIAQLNQTSSLENSIPIFGLQEVLHTQLMDIKTGLGPNWAHLGVARDDGATRGEYSPILYRTDLLRVLYNETKWLSPTPDVVSYGWGAGIRRVVTLGVFEQLESGGSEKKKRFLLANTHLDHASAQARTEGIKVVMARIKAVREIWGGEDLGVVLTGDFNSAQGEGAHEFLKDTGELEELFDLANKEGKVKGTNRLTFTGFGSGSASGQGSFIDFIWVGLVRDKKWTVQGYEILGNVVEGVHISDHRAVVGDILLG